MCDRTIVSSGPERGPRGSRGAAETRSGADTARSAARGARRGAALEWAAAAARLRARRSVSPHTGGSAAPRSAALR